MRVENVKKTRRDFLKIAAAAGVGTVAALYVKPSFRTMQVHGAYTQSTSYTQMGCTPGYWKNHVYMWAKCQYPTGHPKAPGAILSSDLFEEAFVLSVTSILDGKTLLEVSTLGGGGVRALGRHAVAALLNATHPDVKYYSYSAWDVIHMVQDAISSGDSELIEDTKDRLEAANESSCLDNGNGYSISLRGYDPD